MDLNRVRLGHSGLTDKIYLYRHGKDPHLALDRREAEADVMTVLIDHMMHNAPKGSEKVISINGAKYKVCVTPEADDAA